MCSRGLWRLAVCLLLVGGCAGSSRMSQTPPLSLQVTMERTEFLPGEPILVAVTVVNRSSGVVEHVADLSVESGRLGFSLQGVSGRPAHTRALGAMILFPEGHRLGPGERICEVIDLTAHFQELARPFIDHGRVLPAPAFQPGNYTLSAASNPLLMEPYGPRPFLCIEARPVTFTVSDTSAIPASEAAAIEALRLAVPRRQASREEWSEIQTRYAASRFLLPLVRARSGNSVPIAPLADTCLAQGRPLSAAAILQWRVTSLANNEEFRSCEAWLKQRERDPYERELSCFLRAWRERIQVLQRHHRWEQEGARRRAAPGSPPMTKTGSISGHVTDVLGRPLAYANVLLRGTHIGGSANAEGDYFILGVPVGSHLLWSRSMGYTPMDRVVNVTSGGVAKVDFSLDELPTKTYGNYIRSVPWGSPESVVAPRPSRTGIDTTDWRSVRWEVLGRPSVILKIPRQWGEPVRFAPVFAASRDRRLWTGGGRRFLFYATEERSICPPDSVRSGYRECSDTLAGVPFRIATMFDVRDSLYHVTAISESPTGGIFSAASGSSRYVMDQRLFLTVLRSARLAPTADSPLPAAPAAFRGRP